MDIRRKPARHGQTIHGETFGPAVGENIDGGERLAGRGENLAAEDRPNAALLRARHQSIGDVGTRVDDRRDLAARVAQVESRNPGRVVIGEKGHAFGGRDGEAIDIALHGGGQHDARPVIAAKDDGPVDGARRQHGAPGDDPPVSLARHVGCGDRQMIADALDGAIAIVIDVRTPRCATSAGHWAGFATRPDSWRRSPAAAASSMAVFSLSSRPPKQKSSSARMTRAPARPAASAAVSPAGPEPITSTSQKACTFS